MKATSRRKANSVRAASTFLICSLAAFSSAQSGYRIGEDGASADAGPVRMARFDYMKGGVEWRPTDGNQWATASRNLPIRQGSQVYAPDSSRAEVQFDDGSDMRLGGGAVATLVTLYSDSQGEFTEIKLSNGLATFHLTNPHSLYQIDTPTGSIKSYGPAEFRLGDTSGLELACRSGQATYDCACGKTTVVAKGQYLNEASTQAQPVVKAIPAADEWDNFNENRDQTVYQSPPNVPSNIGLVAGDLNGAGTWRDDATYGHVWCPREDPGWRPYSDGNWVYSDPYGWTWVGDESWGWAPYHYGTWVHAGYGWGWCPGPAAQCWSPAVVDFSYYNGNVGWCALAPGDVHYGVGVDLGFSAGGLLLDFSIGRAGCYYPGGGGWCAPRPWSNVFVNRYNGYNTTVINNYYGHSGLGSAWRTTGFVPRNVRFGGGSYVAQNGFGRGGRFQRLDPGRAQFFSKGRSFAMPGRGAGQISGPFNVHPVAASFTPSHSFAGHGPSNALLNRSVYRSSVPRFAARQTTGLGKSFNTPTRTAGTNRPTGPANMNHGAANRFAPANRAAAGAAAAAAARRSVGNRPGGSFGNHANTARPGGAVANHTNAGRARGSFGNHPATNRPGASNANRAAAAHAAAHRQNVAHATAARQNAAHRQAARQNAATRSQAHSHPMIRSNRSSAPAHRTAPVRSNGSLNRSHSTPRAATHRSAPSRPARSYSRPQRSFSRPARSVSRPAPQRSFSRPAPQRSFSRPAPQRSFSAPRSAPTPHFSAPRPSAPRGGGGGGGNHGGGGGHGGGGRRGH